MSAAAASLLTNADSPTTSSSSSPAPSSNSNNPCTLKRVVLLCLLVFIILIVADSITGGSDSLTSQTINSILSWISENPAAGIFIFSLIYIVATIIFVPGSLLTLGSGFSFAQAFGSPLLGTVAGSASVIMGASVGATLAFLLGRYIFRDEVTGWLEKDKSGNSNIRRYWKSIDRALGVQGLKIMFLLRLSPLFPFNLLNYLAGTTAISLKDYCLSLLGIIPGTILYVYLGAASSDLASAGKEGGETLRMVFLIVGAIAGLAGVVWASKAARNELDKINSSEEGNSDGNGNGNGNGNGDKN